MTSQAGRDEDELRAALAEADPVILLMVLVHLTGDLAWLDRARPFIRKAREQRPGDIPAALAQELRARLFDVLSKGALPTPSLGERAYAQMVAVCAGEPVPDAYLRMLSSISGLATEQAATPVRARRGFSVIIIGSGLSGIAMAVYLQKAGIDFLIVERSAEPGGVWADNNYPGCGVDTASHFYSYSFAQNPDWSRYFALQPEIKRYIADCIERFGLHPHLRLGVTVKSVTYSDNDKLWRATLVGPQGEEIVDGNVVVSAVGQLNEPFYPRIEGLETFEGPVVHTARWPAELDCAGKRVALIGTGASSVQVGPTIAPHVQRLVVFQRSPQWFNSRPGYHQGVSAPHRWAFGNIPAYGQWFRLRLAWQFGDLAWPALQVDPARGDGVEVSKANDELRALWSGYMRSQLDGRPDLIAKVIPDYPPLTKRPPVDNGWFDMLKRDNVDLVTEEIGEVGPNFVATKDGVRHEVDVIVLATGFQASRMLQSIQVKGREGRDLRDLWGEDDPRAYLGIAVPGFPNFFLMYGPNTNLGHGGNIIFHGECQANYIVSVLRRLVQSGCDTIEVRQPVFDSFNARLDERLAATVWSTPGVSSSFKNSKGRVRSVSPWRIEEYWRMTRDLDENDYSLS